VQFVWDDINQDEVAAHGVAAATAEAVFFADDFRYLADPDRLNRFTAEGTVDGQLYRVPFSKVFPAGIRITTAFPLSRKRRRT
jgi:uncharacterized DUF497 family protein